MAKKDQEENFKIIARNKRAHFDYEITDKVEAGIVLTGSEVKSTRLGGVSINESHASEKFGELFLFNANIPEYAFANQFNHEPRRPRKLLVKKRERNKLISSIQKKGMTLVPITIYFNHKGLIKISLGLGKGKKVADKRETIKKRDWARDKARILREKNKG